MRTTDTKWCITHGIGGDRKWASSRIRLSRYRVVRIKNAIEQYTLSNGEKRKTGSTSTYGTRFSASLVHSGSLIGSWGSGLWTERNFSNQFPAFLNLIHCLTAICVFSVKLDDTENIVAEQQGCNRIYSVVYINRRFYGNLKKISLRVIFGEKKIVSHNTYLIKIPLFEMFDMNAPLWNP